jgi:hypothetical protein
MNKQPSPLAIKATWDAQPKQAREPVCLHQQHGEWQYRGRWRWTVQFTVDAPVDGTYGLQFRYSLNTRQWGADILVDGSVVEPELVFPATGNWTNWSAATLTTELSAGTHTIEVISAVARGLNLDRLTVIESEDGERPPGGPVMYQMKGQSYK